MNKWPLFDKAICLCLDKRKEYWKTLYHQCQDVGIDMIPYICGDGSDKSLVYNQIDEISPDVTRWGYGVPHLKHHHYNAMLAHRGMIKMAKEHKWKSILLLEDDVYLRKNFKDVMTQLHTELPHPSSYLLFYLGWWKGNEDDEFNTEIEKKYSEKNEVSYDYIGGDLGGLHSVVVREEAYDLLLSLPLNNPIDCQLGQIRQLIPALMLKPKVTHVKNIHSFTEGVTLIRKELE